MLKHGNLFATLSNLAGPVFELQTSR